MGASRADAAGHRPLVLAGLLCAALLAGTMLMGTRQNLPAGGSAALASLRRPPLGWGVAADAPLCWSTTRYVSSDMEREWLDNIEDWQNRYCEVAEPQYGSSEVATWLAAAGAPPRSQLLHSQPVEQDPKVFSRFETTHTCGEGKDAVQTTTVTWIEPLAFGLRHPMAVCGSGTEGKLMDRSYLLLATAADIRAVAGGERCLGRACKRFYFDLGAGTWGSNADRHQPSQGWFYQQYKDRGLEFDHIFMWEALVHSPDSLFGQVPQDLHHKYQYFNVPVSTDPTAADHPLQVLRRTVQRGDFVLFKLDLDNAAVETATYEALLADASLRELVDEFHFEHHVDFKPMLPWWGSSISNLTEADSYQLFLRLRQGGVRAHSWV